MSANISTAASQSLAELFHQLGQPNRILILLTIGREEACVCHIEAVIGVRQATISQHLMVLREAGLVETHRIGRHIFYRLARPELLDAIYQLARTFDISEVELTRLVQKPVQNCPCPFCNPDIEPELFCKKVL